MTRIGKIPSAKNIEYVKRWRKNHPEKYLETNRGHAQRSMAFLRERRRSFAILLDFV